MAEITSRYEGMPSRDEYDDFEEHYEAEKAELEILEKESFNVDTESGEVVGLLIKFPVADGYAYYRVVDDKPLTIQYVPYLDRYKIQPAHIRGLEKEDVIRRSVKNTSY